MTRKFFLTLLAMLTLLVAGCQPKIPLVAMDSSYVDETPRIAVLSAFEPEFNAVLARAQVEQAFTYQDRLIYTAELGGQKVILASSGVSMVNAAMTTQWIIDHFNVSALIISGIAGGANPQLQIGDVVVPAQWAQYQEQVFARETEKGWDTAWYGQEQGNFEMMFPQPVEAHNAAGNQKIFWFQADPAMLEVARQAAKNVELERCTLAVMCLDHELSVEVGGNGVSGSTFVNNKQYREWVWENFNASAIDMESAAVAQVAYSNEIPFIAFRSLSDLAGGEAGANQLPIFMKLAANNAAEMVETFLQVQEPGPEY